MSDLSKELVKSFTELMKESTDSSSKTLNVYGTLKETDDGKFVRIDGSDQYTPITEVTEAKDGDRVLVTIENHSAVVIGNYTFPPSARTANEALDNSKENAKEIVKVNEAVVEAQLAADQAKFDADDAAKAADEAMSNAIQAQQTASQALSSANEATIKADEAQNAIDDMDISMTQLNKDLDEVQTAVSAAQTSADAAQTSANEAKAANAATQAELETTKTAVTNAQTTANTAVENASRAHSAANEAQSSADKANALATEIQKDADKALEEIEDLSSNLETLENTMTTDYAKKTDLSSVESSMQTQISQNAAAIESTASKVTTMDTTFSKKAQDALDAAEAAQSSADAAQTAADNANAEAISAQNAASQAAQAAANAQTQADTAKSAAQAADAKAVTAQNELDTAKANLEAVTSRVGVTEEEITAAQSAVTAAQAAADKAQQDATKANEDAVKAQSTANAAKSDAEKAQTNASNAVQKAEAAQSVANEAKANAESAVTAANTAKTTADAAKETATNAKTTAENAQSIADEAAANAANAQSIADAAQAKVTETQNDLNTAKANLEAVTSRVGVTEEEITAAQNAVTAAQAAADKAKEDAATAQSTANTAKNNAATAQAAADQAQAAAEQAQADADAAQAAADKAQDDVDKLAVTVTEQETKITQNAEAIQLRATKTEVTNTLTGYYTKSETDSAINVKADSITQTVAATYTTKDEFNNLSIGGRNLIVNSAFLDGVTNWGYIGKDASEVDTTFTFNNHPTLKITATGNTEFKWYGRINYYLPKRDISFTTGTTLTLSAWYYVEDKTTFDKGLVVEFKGHKPNTTNANTIMSNVISLEQIIEGKWTKITKTVTLDSDYSECSVYPYVRQNGTVWFADFKLEEGNRPTAWTPAPEDMASTVQMNSAIEQKADSILSTVSANYPDNSEMNSAIQQKADSITSTVAATYTTKNEFNNLSVGGRNLALDTNSYYAGWDWSLGQGGYERTDFVEDGVICAKLTRDDVEMAYWSVISYNHTKIKLNLLKPNTQYVVSFDVKTDIVMNFSCSIRHMNGQHLLVVIEKPTVPNTVPNEWTTVSCVLTTLDTIELNEQVLYLTPNNSDVGRSYSFRNLKIEEGNRPTAWTPAPEDVQGEIDKVSDNLANNYSTTTQMNSAIEQKADSITSTVAATYTTKNEFNNLSVGSRNYVLNGNFKGCVADTTTIPKWNYWGNVRVFIHQGYSGYNTPGTLYLMNNTDSDGGIYQVISKDNIPKNTEFTLSFNSVIESNVKFVQFGVDYRDSSNVLLSEKYYTIDATKGRKTFTFTTPNVDYANVRVIFQHGGSTSSSGNFLWFIQNVKLEKGNKATDFSPAPEDYSTTTEMNSAIQQKADSITSTVAATYTTKDEFNNLSIGGRNLLPKNGISNSSPNVITASFDETSNTWTMTHPLSATAYQGLVTRYGVIRVPYGKTLCVSWEMKVPRSCKVNYDINNTPAEGDAWHGNDNDVDRKGKYGSFEIPQDVAGQWVKYYFTYTNGHANNTNKVDLIDQSKLGIDMTNETEPLTYQIRNYKFEYGNRPTDYSPCPSDYSTTTQMNSAIEQKANSILSTVSTNYPDNSEMNSAIEQKANSILSTVSTNYPDNNEMNSAIQQKADSITSTVAATYTTKNEFNNLSIGGRNLLRNSAFLDGTTYWSCSNVQNTTATTTTTVDNNMVFNGHPSLKIASSGWTTFKWYGTRSWEVPRGDASIKAEETVTISCWYYVSDKSKFDDGIGFEIKGVKDDGTEGTAIVIGVQPNDIVENKWTRVSKTTKVPYNFNNIYAFLYVTQNGEVWFADIKVEEGNKATAWTPAPEDYSTTTQMNSAIEQKADSITSTVAATYTTKDEFNNLSIGGTNILSKEYIVPMGGYDHAVNDFIYSMRVNNQYQGISIIPEFSDLLTIGEVYTLQFKFRKVSGQLDHVGMHIDGNTFIIEGSTCDGEDKNIMHPTANTWNVNEGNWHICIIRMRKFATTPSTTIGLFVIQPNRETTNEVIAEIKDIKFEKGSKMTDWSPAPKDMVSTSQMNSAIQQKADSITSTVAATYTTKNEFNNLALDNTNLFRFSKPYLLNNLGITDVFLTGRGSISKTTYSAFATLGSEDCYAFTLSSEQTNAYVELRNPYRSMYVEEGKTYTFSMYYAYNTNCKGHKVLVYQGTTYIANIHSLDTTTVKETGLRRGEVTWTSTVTGNVYIDIYNNGAIDSSQPSIVYFTNLKFEKGTKATTWTPHPEDVKGSIDATATEIRSELEQTATSITAKFKDTGGYNMIRNSSGMCDDGVPGWSTSSSDLTVEPVITNMDARKHFQSGRCLTIYTSSPSEQYLFSDRIKLKPNTTYTISGRYATDDSSKGTDIMVLTSDTVSVPDVFTSNDTSYDTVAAHFPVNSASQWWYSFSKTFTTGASVKSAYVRIDHNGKLESSTASTSYNWIGDLLLTEGSLVQKWSPHPEEVYTGITKIDKNGLTVSQTGYNGYTIMSANGFFVNDGTENVVQCTTNGLTVKGKINVISGSTVPTSTLSGQVTSTQISDNAITTDKIQANAIVGSKIKVNSVNGDRIVAGSIKGDKLTTNSISTKHLTIGDINNYSELNTDTAEALGFTIIESDQAKNPWFKLNTLQRDTTLNHKGAHNAFENIGEGTYKITYEMSSTVQGYKNSDGSGTPAYLRINIGMYSMKQNGSYSWPLVLGQYGDADGSQHSVSGYITIASDIKSFGIALQLEGWGPFTGECKIRNVKVEKMTDHALIVNGSVTAAKIATNAITSDKIAANAITAGKIAAGAISASHIEGNTLTGTTIVGGTFKNTDNSFSVDSSGNITGAAMSGGTINIGDGAFKVANTGNLKIGGLTGQTIGGYERAQFEVTSSGTAYSVGTDGAYTKMSEGRLYCYNGSNSTTIEGSTITADDLLIGEITNRSGQGLQFNGGGHTVYLRNSSDAGYFDPSVTNSLRLGSTSALWKVGYIVEGVKNSSDRTMKENIQYIPSSNTNDAITTRGCLDFITKDYALATYNYIGDEDKKTKLSAIAQDLLVNEDGSDNVIGQLIVDCEEAANDSSKLTMSQTQLVNVLIGAVQELTKEVNELKAKLKETE